MKNDFFTKTCAFTGHRPNRFSFGFDENSSKCEELKSVMSFYITKLINYGVTEFFSGMALGADQWAAAIVLKMKKKNSDIRLTAVLPNEEQANSWSVAQREFYFETLPLCDEVVTLRERYTLASIFERNRYLVDHTGLLLAVYDGGKRGGTAYTVGYAKKKGCPVITIDPDTLAVNCPDGLEKLVQRD